ncbi:MAG TPA: hypothetical protein DCZ76_12090 [Treponema sp.]|nr:hypothetical protein [Treponema sp.]
MNGLQMLNQVQHDGSLLGGHFFLTQKNPFPEAVEGNLFAKMCRSLRLSKGRVCKEVTALRQAQGPGCFAMECGLRKV